MQEALGSAHYGSRYKDHWRPREGSIVSLSLPQSNGVTIARVAAGAKYGFVSPVPAQDGYAISFELMNFQKGELWLDGRSHKQEQLWENHSVFYDLRHEVEAYLEDPFDFIQFHIPQSFLDKLAAAHSIPAIKDLTGPIGVGVDDPVISGIGKLLLPALDRPNEVSRLFVDHLSLALCAHVAHKYGGGFSPPEKVRGGLASWQLRRAQELLEANLDGDISISEIARECMLSPGHFARQFKRSTGVNPKRWLLMRRVDIAKDLLRDPRLGLAQIAQACGFADQSHLTRVFTSMTGVTPRVWRHSDRG
ncbi:helix-turn-helix domain-containing protein [Microvirga sp. VF16]|uniref:helix-turn-helix domain-containing protein n=1 Tax=Microvirga sp. VF16 TaxID=2807101 RepID=UPI00193E4DFE|nr:AraC family transcriptional regulator [Microvirga sp. VF16]QRM33608.1 helix-turn-helix transcriptional regulator [Microvirga sp. VF16]